MRLAWSATKPAVSPRAAVLGLALWLMAGLALAGEAAVATSVVGAVSILKPDGSTRVLAKDSKVEAGDVVLTSKAGVVRLKFTDDTQITLRPNSRVAITRYGYEVDAPDKDEAKFNLVKGGLRVVSGLVGKRGNKDAHQTETVASTIGIRGTDYALLWCQEGGDGCASLGVPVELQGGGGQPVPGLYLTVFDGAIYAVNEVGSTDFPAGSSAYVRNRASRPIELPRDPGLIREFQSFDSRPGVMVLSNPAAPGACLVH